MNYFQKRELEWQKQQIKDDKRRMAEIKAMMVELQDAIQEEIERNWYVFSSGQGISMEEAYKRSNELDVVRFAKKAKKYVKNRDFSPQANKELKLYNLTMRVNRLELLKANIGLELIRTFDEIDKYVSNELTTVAKEEMKRQAGILYIDVSKNEYTSMLKQIANGSFQGVEFSNLIWSYQNELKADLSKLLQRSIVLGRNPKMLAPELKKYLTEEGKLNAKFNTQRLMVSETTNIQIAIQKQSYLDAGIEKYGYNAEPSACSVCAKLKDKTFLVSEMMPGKNAPSMHPFCRCSTYPVFEIEHAVDELKTGKTGNNGKNEKVDKVDKDELNSGKGRSIIELYKDILTDEEYAAILRYISSESYILNELMRNDIELPDNLQKLRDNLISALDKLPKYSGEINRSLYFYENTDINKFVAFHEIGKTVEYNQFLSFSTKIYDEEDSVRLKIPSSKNSTDLRNINPNEMETLYKPSQRFIVKDKYFEEGKPIIVLEEVE